MGIILWVIFGAIAGWIASMIMKTNTGILGDIIIGIVGALLGGFIARSVFNVGGVSGFNLYSFIVAILGAVLLLWIVKAIRGRTTPSNI